MQIIRTSRKEIQKFVQRWYASKVEPLKSERVSLKNIMASYLEKKNWRINQKKWAKASIQQVDNPQPKMKAVSRSVSYLLETKALSWLSGITTTTSLTSDLDLQRSSRCTRSFTDIVSSFHKIYRLMMKQGSDGFYLTKMIGTLKCKFTNEKTKHFRSCTK